MTFYKMNNEYVDKILELLDENEQLVLMKNLIGKEF